MKARDWLASMFMQDGRETTKPIKLKPYFCASNGLYLIRQRKR